MDTEQLQRHLFAARRYSGAFDGIWGRLTDAGVLLAMSDGPDTALVDSDFAASATRLGVQAAAIRAFWSVEAAGAGFSAGKPKILPERHIFAKLTDGRFNVSNRSLSAPRWDRTWYPKTQDARYDVILAWGRLLSANELSIDAAFGAASWGAPQILGLHAQRCAYDSPFLFAEGMAKNELAQLRAFEMFVTAADILPALREVDQSAKSWEPVAQRYNGTAFRENKYHSKMAAAFAKFGGK